MTASPSSASSPHWATMLWGMGEYESTLRNHRHKNLLILAIIIEKKE